MFRTEASSEPAKYYYSKSTTVVDQEGKTVEMSALRPNMPVSYTYTRDGDHSRWISQKQKRRDRLVILLRHAFVGLFNGKRNFRSAMRPRRKTPTSY
jgi:hypothetical protein